MLVALTVTAVVHTLGEHQAREGARLRAIAVQKAEQVGDWLRERQADAAFVQTSTHYAEEYERWQNDGDTASGDHLQARLKRFLGNKGFSAVILLDPDLRRLWGTPEAPTELAPSVKAAAAAAAIDGQIHRVDPDPGEDGQARLDFVVPLARAPTHGAGRPEGGSGDVAA